MKYNVKIITKKSILFIKEPKYYDFTLLINFLL